MIAFSAPAVIAFGFIIIGVLALIPFIIGLICLSRRIVYAYILLILSCLLCLDVLNFGEDRKYRSFFTL